jgi:hypothetical protein
MSLILGMCSDGKMEVVVPSFVHYLEVLDGADGEKLPGIVELHFLSLLWLDFALNKNMSNRPNSQTLSVPEASCLFWEEHLLAYPNLKIDEVDDLGLQGGQHTINPQSMQVP